MFIFSDIASASSDKTIKIWKTYYQSDFNTTINVDFLTTMKNGAWFTGSNENLTMWNSNRNIRYTRTLSDKISALLNSNENLVIGFRSGHIQVSLNPTNESQLIRNLSAHKSPVIAFANSSNYLVSASNDRSVVVWDAINLINLGLNFSSRGKVLSMIFFK